LKLNFLYHNKNIESEYPSIRHTTIREAAGWCVESPRTLRLYGTEGFKGDSTSRGASLSDSPFRHLLAKMSEFRTPRYGKRCQFYDSSWFSQSISFAKKEIWVKISFTNWFSLVILHTYNYLFIWLKIIIPNINQVF